MVAIVVLAIVPEYKKPLELSDFETSGLLAALGIGIGIGCIGAAVVSGRRILLELAILGCDLPKLAFFVFTCTCSAHNRRSPCQPSQALLRFGLGGHTAFPTHRNNLL